MSEPQLILASSSSYRQAQLSSLGVEFAAINPDIDESPQAHETVHELVQRLAISKAQKLKIQTPKACVIGADQLCTLDGVVFGKPHDRSNCIKQLQTFSDRCVEFFTAVAVLTADDRVLTHTDITVVEFRLLGDAEIMRYVDQEQPLDCAGGFKVESLGCSLFQAVNSSDPTALMGLPLIKLCEFLRQSGYQIP